MANLMVSGSGWTVSQRSAIQRLRRCCRLFAEKHAMVRLAEMSRFWSRGPRVKVLCVSSSGRVEYTKAVSLGCALPVVGFAEGDGGTEAKSDARVSRGEGGGCGVDGGATTMMQWLVSVAEGRLRAVVE